nr:hypothetical protein [Bacillota bacterium]
MQRLWKAAVWAVAVMLWLSSAALAQSPGSQTLETIRLSEVVRSVFYAPQYVALALGFFEEEGLSVELSTAWGADKGAAALLSGSVDIGFFGPEAAVYVYQQGADDPVVGFAQLTARDGSFLMARHPGDTFDWSELRGKTVVGARRGGVPQMVLEYVLRKHGIEPFKDVEIITHLAFEAAPGAFASGLGDYIAQFDPTLTSLERQGVGKVVASLGREAGEIAYTVYHARRSFLDARPETVLAFTRAIYKGQKWVDLHTAAEIAEVVKGFFPEMDDETLVTALERYKSQDSWRHTPIISRSAFQRLLDVMIQAGELAEPVPFDAIMTNRFALAVAEE